MSVRVMYVTIFSINTGQLVACGALPYGIYWNSFVKSGCSSLGKFFADQINQEDCETIQSAHTHTQPVNSESIRKRFSLIALIATIVAV